MRHFIRTSLTILILAPALSACGFTPLYADRDLNLTEALSGISVARIVEPADAGFILEKELRDRFATAGTARYDLKVDLRERRSTLAVTREANIVRNNYTLTANYTLTNRTTGEKYTNSRFAVTGYGIVPSQYASLVGQEDAIRKAAIDVAEQIELDLVLYLKGSPGAADVSTEEILEQR